MISRRKLRRVVHAYHAEWERRAITAAPPGEAALARYHPIVMETAVFQVLGKRRSLPPDERDALSDQLLIDACERWELDPDALITEIKTLRESEDRLGRLRDQYGE